MMRRAWEAVAGNVREQLTSGQRWTATLALGVAVAMLVWRLPAGRVIPGPRSLPVLTVDGFVRALEQIRGKQMARNADVTFGPEKHTGAEAVRTLQWHADCRCWKITSRAWSSLYSR